MGSCLSAANKILINSVNDREESEINTIVKYDTHTQKKYIYYPKISHMTPVCASRINDVQR